MTYSRKKTNEFKNNKNAMIILLAPIRQIIEKIPIWKFITTFTCGMQQKITPKSLKENQNRYTCNKQKHQKS